MIVAGPQNAVLKAMQREWRKSRGANADRLMMPIKGQRANLYIAQDATCIDSHTGTTASYIYVHPKVPRRARRAPSSRMYYVYAAYTPYLCTHSRK